MKKLQSELVYTFEEFERLYWSECPYGSRKQLLHLWNAYNVFRATYHVKLNTESSSDYYNV